MHWILILMLYTGDYRGGVALDHIRFATIEACMKAGNAMEAVFPERPHYICSPDGTQ